MLKIEKFVKDQFGITLTKKQLEMIAIIASNPDDMFGIDANNTTETKQALKAAVAYLQNGLTEAKK